MDLEWVMDLELLKPETRREVVILERGAQPVLVSDLGNCRPSKKQRADARVPVATIGHGPRAPKTRNTKKSRDLGGGPQPVLVSDLGNCRPPKKPRTDAFMFTFPIICNADARVPAATIVNEGPKYLQLYFYDGQHEATNRLSCFPVLREDVIEILMQISQNNTNARFFRLLREVDVTEDTHIVLNQNSILDQRVYNAPSTDEVAGIWPDSASSSQSCSPHIVISGKSSESHRIYHHYGCMTP